MLPPAPPPPETLYGNAGWVMGWAWRTWRAWEWPMYVVLLPLLLAPLVAAAGWLRAKTSGAPGRGPAP